MEAEGVDGTRTGSGPGGLTDSLTVLLVEEDTAGGVFVYDTPENAQAAKQSTQLTIDAINQGGKNEVVGTVQYWMGSSKADDTFGVLEGCVTGN